MTIRTALFGCGRWGRKLLGAVARHPAFELVAVADPDAEARNRAAQIVPQARLWADGGKLLAEREVEAVLIATPTATHAAVAHAVLAAGLDVMVEKPLCDSVRQAQRLCEARARSGVVGMVGHVLCFHPAVQRLVRLGRAGFVGSIERVTGIRATQSGSTDPLWTLAPHDLATLKAIDPSPVAGMQARTTAEGVALEIVLESGLGASFTFSTHARQPARRLYVHGSHWSLGVDELDALAPLKMARSGGERREIDLLDPQANDGEPLLLQLDHFAACIAHRAQPAMCFERAAEIVAVIEQADRALSQSAAHRAVG